MIKKESFKRESYQNDDDVHDFLHITQVLPFYEITMAKTNLTVRFLIKILKTLYEKGFLNIFSTDKCTWVQQQTNPKADD